jgi:hypothetical protein
VVHGQRGDEFSANIFSREGAGVGGSRMTVEVLLRHHQCMRHSSLSVLSLLYPSLYERANKEMLVCVNTPRALIIALGIGVLKFLNLFTLIYGGFVRQIQLMVDKSPIEVLICVKYFQVIQTQCNG